MWGDSQIFPDSAHRREIMDLTVKCPHFGCSWTGELRAVKKHQSECLLKEVQCSNSGCTERLTKEDMIVHESFECSWRKINCEHCQESFVFHEKRNHLEDCQKLPVQCTNKCGLRAIPREKLEVHIRDECLETEVHCEYRNFGCDAMFPRSNTSLHSRSHVERHLSLALHCFDTNQLQVNNLVSLVKEQSQQIEQLVAQVKEQSHERERLEAQVKEQSQQTERLVAQVKEQSQERERLVAQVKEQSHERERLEAQVKEQSQQTERLVAQVKEQSQQIEQLVAQVKEQSHERERLEAQVKEESQKRERLEAQVKEESQKRERLVAQVKEESQKRERLEAQVKELSQQSVPLAAQASRSLRKPFPQLPLFY
nr:TNF receptor-associated factor 2-like [Pocillopora verrucosa]